MDPHSSPSEPGAGRRLLDVMRDQLRTLRYSYRTEQQYLHWVRRFVLFHQRRHPRDLGAREVESFLTHLAVDRRVSASTQNQALSALLFLYQKVLGVELPWLDSIVRAKRSRHVPVVLTHTEVRAVIAQLADEYWLIATLLYGAGLRLQEALQLRVKDVDFGQRQVVVCDGKGAKDRITVLPEAIVDPLQQHLQAVKLQHERAVRMGFAGVELPFAIERKYPHAHLDWGWQYVFPARAPSRDPRTGTRRRHHVFPDTVQKHVKRAVRAANIDKPASCHTFRHSFATHLLERGYDIRTCRNCSVTVT